MKGIKAGRALLWHNKTRSGFLWTPTLVSVSVFNHRLNWRRS